MVMGVNMRTGQIEIAEYDGQIRGQMDLSDFTDADQDQESEETPFVTLGYIYDGAQTLYLILGIVLLALYCGGWIVFRKGNCMAKALTLSILPSVLFLESGILTLNIPLIVLSVVFAICHITISCKNTAVNKQ